MENVDNSRDARYENDIKNNRQTDELKKDSSAESSQTHG
jgi:hypothetical protein